jgi:D-glycero-D-manno-heptose 1,7-bisphosphate phosphatase
MTVTYAYSAAFVERCLLYHEGVEVSSKNKSGAGLYTVFLDRDGVLNRKLPEGSYVRSWGEFELLPGVPEAIHKLKSAGLRVLVVSNQRGIALGLYTIDDVRQIHSEFQKLLLAQGTSIDGFYFCPHNYAECNCRKPLPGLFLDAKADSPEISAETSVMIGDSLSDIEFGRQLGMRTILVQGDPSRQKASAKLAGELADMQSPSLLEAANAVLAELNSTPAAAPIRGAKR